MGKLFRKFIAEILLRWSFFIMPDCRLKVHLNKCLSEYRLEMDSCKESIKKVKRDELFMYVRILKWYMDEEKTISECSRILDIPEDQIIKALVEIDCLRNKDKNKLLL